MADIILGPFDDLSTEDTDVLFTTFRAWVDHDGSLAKTAAALLPSQHRPISASPAVAVSGVGSLLGEPLVIVHRDTIFDQGLVAATIVRPRGRSVHCDTIGPMVLYQATPRRIRSGATMFLVSISVMPISE